MVRRVSGLANDKAVSSCLDDFDRDNLDVVDAQGELASHIGHVRQRLHAHSLRHKAPQKLRQIIPQTTTLGSRPAADVTPQELERWLRAHCKTPATSNRYKAFISLCFREGIHNGKVTSNPARQVRSKRESLGRLRYLTRKEYDLLCTVILARFPTHLAEFVVSVNTGMRLSEQYSLTWGQVNLERRTIDLTKTKNGPLGPYTSTPMQLSRSNPFASRNRSRTTPFFLDKGRPLIRAPGFTHLSKMPKSRSMSGIQTATHFVPGCRWLEHPSRKFKNSPAISRSSCQRDIATCLPSTGSQWSSA